MKLFQTAALLAVFAVPAFAEGTATQPVQTGSKDAALTTKEAAPAKVASAKKAKKLKKKSN